MVQSCFPLPLYCTSNYIGVSFIPGATQGRDSLADVTAGPTTEMDSANSSPGVIRVSTVYFLKTKIIYLHRHVHCSPIAQLFLDWNATLDF